MIHGANGYLACELLSKRFNKRTDAYGGDLKGRAKYLIDIVRVAREKTSPDFPVILRLMGADRVSTKGGNEGWSIADCVEACKMMEANGATAIDITSGSQETPQWSRPYWFMPQGLNADITEAIKKGGVKIPVWVTGKLTTHGGGRNPAGRQGGLCLRRTWADRRSILADQGQGRQGRRYLSLHL